MGNCISLEPVNQNEELTLKVLNNPLIFPEILKYLPLNDLKNARLVNTTWLDNTEKYFYQQACVSIDAQKFYFNPQVRKYLQSEERHINFKIYRNTGKLKLLKSMNPKDFATDEEDDKEVINLIKSRKFPIKFLNLKLSLDSKTDFTFFKDVLNNSNKIEELFLHIYIWEECSGIVELLNDIQILSSMKRLKLNFLCVRIEYPNIQLEISQLFQKLVYITPNLRSLKVSGPCERYIEEVARVQDDINREDGPLPFKNLATLSVTKEDVKIWNHIAKLEQPIRRLEFGSDLKTCLNNTSEFHEALQQHSDTLETLCVSYNGKGGESGIVLPTLPELNTLRLKIYTDSIEYKTIFHYNNLPLQEIPGELRFFDPFGIKPLRNEEVLDFLIKFPKLGSLEVSFVGSGSAIINNFYPIPKEDGVFTLKQVTTKHKWAKLDFYKATKEKCLRCYEEVAKMIMGW